MNSFRLYITILNGKNSRKKIYVDHFNHKCNNVDEDGEGDE